MVQIKAKKRVLGEVSVGNGSGFFYRAPNMIATAYHVVEGAESIEIINSAGTKFSATSLWIDGDSDVALLRIATKTTGPVLKGKLYANVAVGETVYAIGNPLGRFPDTITSGLVSAKRKYDGIPVIQTSAAISKGNSGGPLLDDRGNVLGIVDAYASEAQNTNFAIAMNQADSLLAKNDVYTIGEFLAYNREAPTRVEISANAKNRPRLLFTFDLGAETLRTAVSPDGQFVAVSGDKEVALVSKADGKAVHRSRTKEQIRDLVYHSADRLYLFYEGSVEVRSPQTWDLVATHALDAEIFGSKLSADGAALYYGTADETKDGEDFENWRVVKLDLATGKSVVLRGSLASGATFALNGAEDRLYVVEETTSGSVVKNRVVSVNLGTGETSTIKEVERKENADSEGFSVEQIALEPVTGSIAISFRDIGKIQGFVERINPATGTTASIEDVPPLFGDLVFAGSEHRLLTSSLTHAIFYNLQRRGEEFRIAHDGFAAATSAKGDTLALAHGNTVRVYSIFSADYVGEWTTADSTAVLHFRADGSSVVTGTFPYNGQDLTARFIGTWKDTGDAITMVYKNIEIDGLLDSDSKEVDELRKRVKQMPPITLQPSWIDSDTFRVGDGKNIRTYTRKPASLPESKQ